MCISAPPSTFLGVEIVVRGTIPEGYDKIDASIDEIAEAGGPRLSFVGKVALRKAWQAAKNFQKVQPIVTMENTPERERTPRRENKDEVTPQQSREKACGDVDPEAMQKLAKKVCLLNLYTPHIS